MVKASGTQSSGIVRLVHHKACCLLCMQVYEKSLRRGDARCTQQYCEMSDLYGSATFGIK